MQSKVQSKLRYTLGVLNCQLTTFQWSVLTQSRSELSVASKTSNFLSSLLNISSVAYLVKKIHCETEFGNNQNRFWLSSDDRHIAMRYINKNSTVTVPTDITYVQPKSI